MPNCPRSSTSALLQKKIENRRLKELKQLNSEKKKKSRSQQSELGGKTTHLLRETK